MASSALIQKRVFLQWVSLLVKERITSINELQDGIVLSKVMQALTKSEKPPAPLQKVKNKLQVMGNINTLVKFIVDQGIRVTCSAEDIYDGRENMIFGLIWILILQFQIVNKAEMLEWLRDRIDPYGIQITNFDSNWQNGLAFCALVASLKPDLMDFASAKELSDQERLKQAFSIGESNLGIPSLLSEDDGDEVSLDERCILTYLSYFYNNFKNEAKAPPPEKIDYAAIIADLNSKLERAVDRASQNEAKSLEILTKTTSELEELKLNFNNISEELKGTNKANVELSRQIIEMTDKIETQQTVVKKDAPQGIVSLVFTDVQSSTALWEQYPEQMASALQLHNRTIRALIENFDGYEVKTEGDAFMVAFSSPLDAANFCLQVQLDLLHLKWPERLLEDSSVSIENDFEGKMIFRGLRVRMGVHTGEPICEPDPVTGRMDYFGPMVNRAARVASIPHGGQIVVSQQAWVEIRRITESQSEKQLIAHESKDLGGFRLKGLEDETFVFQILPESLANRFFNMEGKGQSEAVPKVQNAKGLREEMEKLKVDHVILQRKLKKLKESADEAKEKAEELSAWVESQRAAIEAGGGAIGDFVIKVDWITKNQSTILGLIKDTEEKTSFISNSIERLDNNVTSINRDEKFIEGLHSQIDSGEKEKSTLQKKLDDLRAHMQELNTSINYKDESIDALTKKNKENEAQIQDLEGQIKLLTSKKKKDGIFQRIIRTKPKDENEKTEDKKEKKEKKAGGDSSTTVSISPDTHGSPTSEDSSSAGGRREREKQKKEHRKSFKNLFGVLSHHETQQDKAPQQEKPSTQSPPSSPKNEGDSSNPALSSASPSLSPFSSPSASPSPSASSFSAFIPDEEDRPKEETIKHEPTLESMADKEISNEEEESCASEPEASHPVVLPIANLDSPISPTPDQVEAPEGSAPDDDDDDFDADTLDQLEKMMEEEQ